MGPPPYWHTYEDADCARLEATAGEYDDARVMVSNAPMRADVRWSLDRLDPPRTG